MVFYYRAMSSEPLKQPQMVKPAMSSASKSASQCILIAELIAQEINWDEIGMAEE